MKNILSIALRPTLWRQSSVPQSRRRFSGDKKKGKPKPKAKAKPAAKKEPEAAPVTERIQAPYKFTPEESSVMEKRLRGALSEIDTLEEQKKTSAKDFALRIESRENEVSQLRHRLDTGEETREMEVHVEFDVTRQKKQYLHPTTRDFIREEDMTAADNQLPMFQPTGEPARHAPSQPVVPPKPVESFIQDAVKDADDDLKLKGHFEKLKKQFPDAYKGNRALKLFMADVRELADKNKPETSQEDKGEGQTSVGAALDKTAKETKCAPIALDLAADYTSAGLVTAFKKAAKAAGWNQAQINVLRDQVVTRDTVEGMKDTLRPHVAATSQDERPPM